MSNLPSVDDAIRAGARFQSRTSVTYLAKTMRLVTLCALTVIADAGYSIMIGADSHRNSVVELLTGVETLGGDETVFATVMRLGGIYGPGRDLEARIRSLAGAVWDRLSPGAPEQTLALVLKHGRRPGTMGTTRDDA